VIYKTRKRYRGEPICADPTADPHENETALHFTAGDRRLWISSYEPTVVAGLLAHPSFQIGHLVLMKANGRECVVGVVGKLPVGALSLGRARKSDSHELIVPGKRRLAVFATPIEEKRTLASKKKPKEEPRQLKLKLAGRAKSHTTKQPEKARKSRVKREKMHAKATHRRATHRSSKRVQRTRST
jgi:hypothetical protein